MHRWLLVLALALASVIPACAVDAQDDELEDEPAAETEAELVTIKPNAPIALHYGFLQAVPDVKDRPSGAATAKLRARNVENVLVTSRPPSDPEARAWGGKLARHLPARVIADPSRGDTLLANLGDLAGFVRRQIDRGYAYVAVDELQPEKSDFLADSDPRSDVFVKALAAMNADPLLQRRIIVYVNSYNMAGSNFSDLTKFGKVLRACRDYCRVVASEMYLGTAEAFRPGAATPRTTTQKGGCANGVDCMGFVVNKMEQVAPGIRARTITVLGVEPSYKRAGDPNSFCTGRGALRAEIAKIRSLRQPGMGTYSLSRVANDVSPRDFPGKQAAFTSCVRTLVQGTSFPAVPN